MTFPSSAGVILRHGSHIFLLHRSPKSKHWPLYWGVPGGKMEDGEDPFSAAKRELLEETGVHIDSVDIVKKIIINAHYIDGKREYTMFLCNTWDGTPENKEISLHVEAGWYPLDELPEPMVPHIKEGLFALLEGKTTIEYDGQNEKWD